MASITHLHDNDNLETFHLLWLDNGIDEAHRNTQTELRASINHLKTFVNAQEFQEYIERISDEDRAIVVMDNQRGQEVVPLIHQLEHISSIYIYCINSAENTQWIENYSKVGYQVTILNFMNVFLIIDQACCYST